MAAEANASSAAEDLAAEHDVDIHEVEGTGKDGLITKSDVQKHIDGNGASGDDETVYGEGDKAIVDARKSASYYCPGCGKPTDDEHLVCEGTAEAPHQPIAVVPTDELSGDPAKHTAAPDTEQ